MKWQWLALTLVVLVVGVVALRSRLRAKSNYEARVIAAAMVVYGFVVLVLAATESDVLLTPDVNINGTLKVALLAVSGGWLAQVVIILNKLAYGVRGTGRVLPVFINAVMGSLCGLVAAALAAVALGSFESLPDTAAGLAGVAGGALGITILDLVKKWYGARGPTRA